MKTWIAAVVFGALAVPACVAADTPALDAPRKAPDFTFTVPGKGPQQLSDYQGKVVALEFVFTYCSHCQDSTRKMIKIQEEYQAKGLQVIAVAVNPNADLLVENFIKDFKVTYPVGWATQEAMLKFMGFTGGRFVVPQMALIDRKGMIRYQTPASEDTKWDKLMEEPAIRAHVQELLALSGGPAHGATAARSSKEKRQLAAVR